MANLRGNRIIEAHITVTVARNEVIDGESMRRFHDLTLVRATATFFALSWTAVHPIDAASPLYGCTRDELEREEDRDHRQPAGHRRELRPDRPCPSLLRRQ